MRKIITIIIIVVVAFVAAGFLAQLCVIDDGALPSKVEDMDFVVKTDSRNYFTDSYSWQGDTLVLHGFWVKEGKRWRHYDRDLKLNPQAYGLGGINVERR